MDPYARFPRTALAHLPTPLEPCPGISQWLDGPEIWVKRDDQTGLGGGGNKTRKLEFLIADALQGGADVVLTAGGIQSNHVRQTAAAAARVGIECCVVLEEPAAAMAPEFFASGNLLLDRFFRAQVKRVPAGTDTHAALAEWAAELEMAGARPYIIPVGGSNAIGALGYVICAQELVEQVRDWPTLPAAIVVATASAGTQAGLVAGLFLEQVSIPVVGMCVSRSSDEQDAKVEALANEVLEFLGYTGAIPPPLIMTHDAEVGQAMVSPRHT